jgi:hypothetical protein
MEEFRECCYGGEEGEFFDDSSMIKELLDGQTPTVWPDP